MKVHSHTEIIGWLGTIFIVAAYIASGSSLISVHSAVYLWANLLGSAGIFYNCYRKKDLQPLALNIVWLLVAAIGLLRFM